MCLVSSPAAPSSTELPDGAYFSVIGNVRVEAGGQTRLALLRHRLFTLHAGVSLPILTYNPVPSYEPIRAELRAQGQLLDVSELRNLHEELREWAGLGEGTGDLPDPGTSADDVDGGYPWRRRHGAGTPDEVWDYLRRDGSRYLRTPPTDVEGEVFLCGADGRPVQSWPALGGLWRWWTRQVMPPTGRVFLISDSRFIAEELGRLHDPRVHLLHQMHNPHLTGERRWWSPVSDSYRTSMERLGELDALLSLTDRQRADIEKRYGSSTQLFVVPNPVESPPMPATPPDRDLASIVMIARLDGQKRLDRAVEALALVRRQVPNATLDIYGDGPLRAQLEQQIAAAGLDDAVTLHGHDPRAREALWRCGLFWLTSAFEGYPLSTLEAMSHACPVVSMDMPYGPREQITDGADGFLVGPGDVAALADRTVALLQRPELLAPMRRAARATAEAHGHERFLADWASVLHEVVALKEQRRSVTDQSWSIERRFPRGRACAWTGRLDLATPDRDHLDDLELVAEAWSPETDQIVELPQRVSHTGTGVRFEGSITRAELRSRLPGAATAHLRVGYRWANLAAFEPITTSALPLTTWRRWR